MKKLLTISILLICLLSVALLASCSSGGGLDAMIRGKIQQNYGISVDNSQIVVTIDSTQIYPDKRGYFYYHTDPGQHNIIAAYADVDRGIYLAYTGHVNLGDKELLDLPLYMRDNHTQLGWTFYRDGQYADAVGEFEHIANVSNNNDALNGLGWSTWMLDRNYSETIDYFKRSVKEVRNVEARIGMCGVELSRVATDGDAAFGRAYQNICLALNEPDGFTTLPRHDAVHEGDMYAMKALLSYISGDVGEAEYILNNQEAQLTSDINAHGQDMVDVLMNFMGGG